MTSVSPEIRCEISQAGEYQKYEYLVYDIYGIGVIGYGVVYQNRDSAEIKVINVDRYHRGEGIGSSMLERIVEDHSEKNIQVKTFDSLIPWYQKFGFKVINSEPLLLMRASSII
ncbi:MAG: GNAT family N-acetyltransferase [Candidatus Jordarchaeum sp.]|uniref:GNAT family N-acetyltransferase n=1 Tax=Candidatus Jordarchaeum sp. TaxID=2823881 RepID=UPI0040493E0F